MSLAERWQAELDELRALGRDRHLRPGSENDFSSNDYLGYGARVFSNPNPLPRGATASRLLRGHHPLWDVVEDRITRWHGAEAALIFNSGYVANEGLLSAVIGSNDWVASDQCNHASIIDGLRLTKADKVIFPHNDLEALERLLRDARQSAPPSRSLFVVTEAHFSMEGDLAPLAPLAELTEKYGAYLIVDEAHSTGCFGPQGSGLVDDLGLRGRVLATIHTGGKALGVPGAYVAGSRLLREYLINRCRHLIFTTALPPQIASWWKEALERVWHDDAGRRRLHGLAAAFRVDLTKRGVPVGGTHFIATIPIGDDAAAMLAAASLQEAGFDVRAIRPPTVLPGTARLRISIHADHESAVLGALAERIAATIHVTK
jgi:8-amino-7-oxononanoate synthase